MVVSSSPAKMSRASILMTASTGVIRPSDTLCTPRANFVTILAGIVAGSCQPDLTMFFISCMEITSSILTFMASRVGPYASPILVSTITATFVVIRSTNSAGLPVINWRTSAPASSTSLSIPMALMVGRSLASSSTWMMATARPSMRSPSSATFPAARSCSSVPSRRLSTSRPTSRSGPEIFDFKASWMVTPCSWMSCTAIDFSPS
mmetsp:Transcript_85189/g.227731  ORF Transcript_85189/g.227731 Transcript_85189/m.227731 type:complete len:206 (-) Transcript_85189:1374-1991(-)